MNCGKISNLLVVFTTQDLVYWLVSLLKCTHREVLPTFFSIGAILWSMGFWRIGNLELRQPKLIPKTPGTKTPYMRNFKTWGNLQLNGIRIWKMDSLVHRNASWPRNELNAKKTARWLCFGDESKKIKCQNYWVHTLCSELWSTHLGFQTKWRICIRCSQ